MQQDDKEINTVYLYAAEKERYEAQIRSLRAQADTKIEDINKLETVQSKSEESLGEVKTEVDELEKINMELEETVKQIENTISSKQLEEDIVQKTNTQVEKVEKLRKEKINVYLNLSISSKNKLNRKKKI